MHLYKRKRPQKDDIKIYLLFRKLPKVYQHELLSLEECFQSCFSLELTQGCRQDDPPVTDGVCRIPPRVRTYLHFLRQFWRACSYFNTGMKEMAGKGMEQEK